MSRIFNFSAGPATLPEEVLAQAGDELLDWRGSGMSVMEMSHRGKVTLVVDASSHFLSRPLEVGRFGLVYAGAQKNLGPAGLTIVIVREDLIGRAQKGTPSVMDYKAQAEADSMLNTPATYSIYVA